MLLLSAPEPILEKRLLEGLILEGRLKPTDKEVAAKTYAAFVQQCAPLKAYYKRAGKLVEVRICPDQDFVYGLPS